MTYKTSLTSIIEKREIETPNMNIFSIKTSSSFHLPYKDVISKNVRDFEAPADI